MPFTELSRQMKAHVNSYAEAPRSRAPGQAHYVTQNMLLTPRCLTTIRVSGSGRSDHFRIPLADAKLRGYDFGQFFRGDNDITVRLAFMRASHLTELNAHVLRDGRKKQSNFNRLLSLKFAGTLVAIARCRLLTMRSSLS